MSNNPDPSRIYCPGCGADAEKWTVPVEGYLGERTFIFHCDWCDTLIEDGCFVYKRPPR